MENSRPLAVVGTIAITDADVTQAIMGMGARAESFNNPQGRAAVLEKLIEQALFLTDARKNMMEYDPVFKKQLQSVKDELLTQFAVSKAIERATVTEAEITAFFDQNPDQFQGQETVSASHILVDSEEKANELMGKIQSGETAFEDCAKECSSCPSGQNGGSLGEFGHGQMVPEFDEACFSMEVGELRGPVKSQFGYHIIRLDSKKAAEPMKLAEVHDAIREHLLTEKRRQAYQSRVNQMKIMYPVNR